MAPRMMMMGVVACLGFELPSGGDITTWGRTGRDWVQARWSDLSGLRAEADRTLASATDCGREAPASPATLEVSESLPMPADLAFEAISEGMASSFSADRGGTVELADSAQVSTTADESAVSVDELIASDAIPSPSSAFEDAEVHAPPSSSRIERLTLAIEQTRLALSAWASLIETPKSGPIASR